MSVTIARGANREFLGFVASSRYGMLAYAAALLLSASLLFSVQPLFAKIVLPQLGGSPSVWAVAMCFFQAALLAGYCYAHLLNRFVPAQFAPLLHLAVCSVAALTLPFGLPEWADNVPSGSTYLWLIAVLAVGVGLPFFAVSANAPLLQAWFARSGHVHANDPYFLYGASNFGSLVSLLAYPFVIEPLLGLDAQRSVWAFGFYLLMVMIAVCGVLLVAALRGRPDQAEQVEVDAAASTSVAAKPITALDRMIWIALAFVPSALLVAFTTHITTDIASAPFLWVIPLAAFLGTFVVVFRNTSMIPDRWMLAIHPPLVALSLLFLVIPSLGGAMLHGVIGFITFVVTTLVCHRVLYNARPAAARLTEFYLFMSLGGVLGGMFAALIAPQLFNTVAEYPLLMLAGLFARPGVVAAVRAQATIRQMVVFAVGALAVVIALTVTANAGVMTAGQVKSAIAVLCVGAVIVAALTASRPELIARFGLAAATLFIASGNISIEPYIERSFFGVSRVMDTTDGRYRLLIHGSTLHGGEMRFDAAGKPADRPPPILYYHPGAPMAGGFDVARATQTAGSGPLRVGVIGLGTGSLTCHLKNNETIKFYEIDPVVDRIARNPALFRYISQCAPNMETVIGDARLTLAKSNDRPYDYFVVDAFSSDAVPVHLLTREAIELYLSKVTDQGLIAFHISNRHLELESVVAAIAKTLDGVHTAAVHEPDGLPGLDGNPSHVVFLSKNQMAIDKILNWKHGRAADPRATRPWTDNYADILSALWRQYTK